MTSATTRPARGTRGRGGEGYGLVLFAAVMLLVTSFFNLIDGIAAIANSHVFVANAHFVIGDLRAWGWTALILSVLQVFVAVVLIFLILMHSGKDSGLSGAFGVGTGSGPLGGGSLVERNLNRWTVAFAVVFAVNTVILLKIGA